MTATLTETINSLGPERAARLLSATAKYQARLIDLDVTATTKGFTRMQGRAVPYDTWADVGWYLESHAWGSLYASTTERPHLPLLLWHDRQSFPIGVSTGWEHRVDGLVGTWTLNDRDEAQEAARLAKSGELGHLSIGFQPIRSQWDMADHWAPELGYDFMDRVTRLESRLLEVSVVATPAFADAEILDVRSAR